jgi:hypothetical protein
MDSSYYYAANRSELIHQISVVVEKEMHRVENYSDLAIGFIPHYTDDDLTAIAGELKKNYNIQAVTVHDMSTDHHQHQQQLLLTNSTYMCGARFNTIILPLKNVSNPTVELYNQLKYTLSRANCKICVISNIPTIQSDKDFEEWVLTTFFNL